MIIAVLLAELAKVRSLSHINMGKEILTFSNTEIERNKCYRHENPIFLKKDVDTKKVLASNKISCD